MWSIFQLWKVKRVTEISQSAKAWCHSSSRPLPRAFQILYFDVPFWCWHTEWMRSWLRTTAEMLTEAEKRAAADQSSSRDDSYGVSSFLYYSTAFCYFPVRLSLRQFAAEIIIIIIVFAMEWRELCDISWLFIRNSWKKGIRQKVKRKKCNNDNARAGGWGVAGEEQKSSLTFSIKVVHLQVFSYWKKMFSGIFYLRLLLFALPDGLADRAGAELRSAVDAEKNDNEWAIGSAADSQMNWENSIFEMKTFILGQFRSLSSVSFTHKFWDTSGRCLNRILACIRQAD